MKISIIIPIYNVEKYLDRCLKSVINQTYQDFEVIMVNDGSVDGSEQICKNYLKEDSRFILINKKNGGLSDARNYGIDAATGEYIYFLDSDDYISKDTIKVLANLTLDKKADIVVGNGYRIEEGKKTHIKKSFGNISKPLSGVDFLTKSILQKNYIACVWLNLYSLKLIKDNKFYFKQNLLHEDELWTPQVFLKAENVYITDKALYFYVIRKNSITTTKTEKNTIDIINTCYELEHIFNKSTTKSDGLILKSHLSSIYINAIIYSSILKSKNFSYNKTFPLKNSINSVGYLKALIFYFNPVALLKLNKFFKKGIKNV